MLKRYSPKTFYFSSSSSETNGPHVNAAYHQDEKPESETNKRSKDSVVLPGDTSAIITTGQQTSGNPVTYTWENLEVEVDIVQRNFFKRKKSLAIRKRILDNVTGAVRPGEFLAIMGASGAGKTTLLNCLTFRNSGNLKIRGKRLLNGIEIDRESLARISGYVQQDDLFIGTLKVEEVLRFQALLRMDKHFTYAERMERVEEVIVEFGLTKCRNTLIGDPDKGIQGISGGERKRLAFACEVLTNPSLMFCDEPTSGLDSFMAQNVVQAMKNIAQQGKTVICTIHQPSSEVFEMFDRILLMAEGRTAFLGPIHEALQFFSSNGMPCPTNYNPADFYIFTLAVVPGQETACKQKIKSICDIYDNSETRHRIDEIVKQQHHSNSGTIHLPKSENSSPYKASWFSQFTAVLWRSWISVVRNPQIFLARAASTIFTALLVSLIYQGQSLDADSVQNVQGVLFFFLINLSFDRAYAVVDTFSFELPIFLREHHNGMYRTDVYFLCKTLADLLFFILLTFVSIAIPYYAIGLNPDISRFFIATGIIILVSNVATSFGYFMSCLCPSPQVAYSLTGPLINPLYLFGGFMLKKGSIPVYLDWFHYVSWFMYSNEALSINQWQGVVFDNNKCTYADYNLTAVIPPDSLTPDLWKTIVNIFTAFQETVVCSGEDVLENFNFNKDYFYRNVLCLFALILGLRILAFTSLLRKTYQKH